jgi:hypothetical protein
MLLEQAMSQPLSPRWTSKIILGWLSMLGILVPGLQRFYLRQRTWGWAYLALGFLFLFPIGSWKWFLSITIRVLCFLEAAWILTMDNDDFNGRFNRDVSSLEWTSVQGKESQDPEQQLEQMLNSGLITAEEYQERRKKVRKIPSRES